MGCLALLFPSSSTSCLNLTRSDFLLLFSLSSSSSSSSSSSFFFLYSFCSSAVRRPERAATSLQSGKRKICSVDGLHASCELALDKAAVSSVASAAPGDHASVLLPSGKRKNCNVDCLHASCELALDGAAI